MEKDKNIKRLGEINKELNKLYKEIYRLERKKRNEMLEKSLLEFSSKYFNQIVHFTDLMGGVTRHIIGEIVCADGSNIWFNDCVIYHTDGEICTDIDIFHTNGNETFTMGNETLFDNKYHREIYNIDDSKNLSVSSRNSDIRIEVCKKGEVEELLNKAFASAYSTSFNEIIHNGALALGINRIKYNYKSNNGFQFNNDCSKIQKALFEEYKSRYETIK